MPSNSPIHSHRNNHAKGCLYIVSTPIGNRDDITLRALKILKNVDWIASEDTRHTGALLASFQIKGRLISCHEHNEKQRIADLMEKLHSGASVALVTDAGTPLLSDPGFKLVAASIVKGIRIVPIPGVSAAVAALSVAGLPTDQYFFVGFLAKKEGKRRRELKKLARQTGTLVIYESPRRILKLIGTIIDEMGDRDGVLAREMTKIHEEFLRGRLSDIANELAARPKIKGECTLLIRGWRDNDNVSLEAVRNEIRQRIADSDASLSDIAKEIADKCPLSKNEIYTEALVIKKRHRK